MGITIIDNIDIFGASASNVKVTCSSTLATRKDGTNYYVKTTFYYQIDNNPVIKTDVKEYQITFDETKSDLFNLVYTKLKEDYPNNNIIDT